MPSFTTSATAAGIAALVAFTPVDLASQAQTAPPPAEAQMRDSVRADSIRARARMAAVRAHHIRDLSRGQAGARFSSSGRVPAFTLQSQVNPDVRRVRSVMENGSTVRLDDGTVWEVWVGDRARSAGWGPGDAVRLSSIPAPSARGYDVRLENVTSDWKVAARLTAGGRR